MPTANQTPPQAWKDFNSKTTTRQAGLKIGLAGTVTLDPLIPHLGGSLVKAGLEPDIEVGPYHQIHQLCRAPDGFFKFGTPDVIVIIWRIEDMLGELLWSTVNDARTDENEVHQQIGHFFQAIATLKVNFSGTLVVSTPPYPSSPEFDVTALKQATTGMAIYSRLLEASIRALDEIDSVAIVDMHGLISKLGSDNCHDARKWYLYRQPYTELMWQSVGRQVSRVILAGRVSPRKVIVLDCDNTLWGGIVGEDGISGIDIGRDFPGSAFRDFQLQLLQLQQRGTLLAVASKNNPQDVFEVFDDHDEMILRREHISVFQVHWHSKAQSITEIASALNLSVDSFVFIDDNPKELAEVSAAHPQVVCLQAPEEEAELTGLLLDNDLFDSAQLTEEDKNRSVMIRAEVDRQEQRATISHEDFINSLELKVVFFEAQPQHHARAVQLINKTNQFNVTTRRRSEEEFDSLIAGQSHRVYCIEVSDRFGSYGLVGVAILAQVDPDIWQIDTLLMSCRVLGREVETAFIEKLAEATAKLGGSRLHGCYQPTRKNSLVQHLYRDHGFLLDDGSGEWQLSVDQAVAPSPYVTSVWK